MEKSRLPLKHLYAIALALLFGACSQPQQNTQDTPTYTVVFFSQGGSAVSNLEVQKGSDFLLPPDPIYSGHTFAGWYRESNCINKWQNSPIYSDVALYAKWIRGEIDEVQSNATNMVPTYLSYSPWQEVICQKSGELSNIDMRILIASQSQSIKLNVFRGTGISGQRIGSSSIEAGSVALANAWQNDYWISFPLSNIYVNAGEHFTIEIDAQPPVSLPIDSIYFSESDVYPGISDMDSSGLHCDYMFKTYVDTMSTAPATCTVSFDSNGGTTVSSISNVASGSTINAPTAPSYVGFGFVGWYIDPGLTTAWDFAIYTVTTDTILYAKWGLPQDSSIFGSYKAWYWDTNLSSWQQVSPPNDTLSISATDFTMAGTQIFPSSAPLTNQQLGISNGQIWLTGDSSGIATTVYLADYFVEASTVHGAPVLWLKTDATATASLQSAPDKTTALQNQVLCFVPNGDTPTQ